MLVAPLFMPKKTFTGLNCYFRGGMCAAQSTLERTLTQNNNTHTIKHRSNIGSNSRSKSSSCSSSSSRVPAKALKEALVD